MTARRDIPLSIIIPCLNENECIAEMLDALAPLRKRGAEIIVVDGGSTDATAAIAQTRADTVLSSPRGRAMQMNTGARAARGTVLLFLHADTRLPEHADRLVREGLEATRRCWGRFDVTIHGRHPLLVIVALAMNLRSRLTGIATGDQALFVTREAFDRVGGFAPIVLMEDIAFSKRLLQQGRPLCLRQKAVTSGRRWEKEGVLRTILLMWRLRIAYARGVDPNDLAARYAVHK